MPNPFTGIITPALKELHKNMIDALLEDEACTVLCTLYYESKFTDCPNCIINGLTGKSSGRYQTGGPILFDGQICPYCNGAGRIQIPSTESLYLMPIWNSKDFVKNLSINMADVKVQTMSKIGTYDNLKRATRITIDEAIKKYGTKDFARIGDPEPCGFGASNFIICSWGNI